MQADDGFGRLFGHEFVRFHWIANTETLYVNVYLANPYANALIECIPHRVIRLLATDAIRVPFDNHIHINDDLAVFWRTWMPRLGSRVDWRRCQVG